MFKGCHRIAFTFVAPSTLATWRLLPPRLRCEEQSQRDSVRSPRAHIDRNEADKAAIGMWHGVSARFYRGTVVTLREMKQDIYNGEACTVREFDAIKGKWLVALQNEIFDGQLMFVPEENLLFSFYVNPAALAVTHHRRTEGVNEQGACGRGLVVREAISRDEPIFAETPIIVTPTGVKSMWRDRWRCYMAMIQAARWDETMDECVQAFDSLTEGDGEDPKGTTLIENEANTLFEEATRAAVAHGITIPDGVRAQEVARVCSVLQKFQSNQFKLGSEETGAAAVFSYTSQMNHCCNPSVILEPQWTTHRSGSFEPKDGRIIARATRDLQEGEFLTISYGPRALREWPLEKRRSYLLAKNGFLCLCDVCCNEQKKIEDRPKQ